MATRPHLAIVKLQDDYCPIAERREAAAQLLIEIDRLRTKCKEESLSVEMERLPPHQRFGRPIDQ